MLSFQQKVNSNFAAATADVVPADVHRNPARSLVLEAPDVREHTLDSKVRRERYLTDLAGKYVSRWQIVSGADETKPINADVMERSFYASMPISLERRKNMAHMILTADQERKRAQPAAPEEKKEKESEQIVLDAGTQCWSGTMMHDWSLDQIRTDALTIKNRPHTLCKYTHPCNDGSLCVPVAEKAQPSNTTVATDQVSHVVAAGGYQGGLAYMEELRKRLEERTGSTKENSEQVVSKVEKRLTKRRREQRRARERELKEAAEVRKESEAVCTRLIERTRAMRNGHSTQALKRIRSRRERSLLCEAYYEDADSLTASSESISSSSRSTNSRSSSSDDDDDDDESGSSSATFSDETEPKYDYEEDAALNSSPLESNHPEEHQQQASDEAKEKEKEEVEEDDDSVKEKEQVVRQSNTEVLVPICEPTDTFRFFEQLECPYVMQWADEDHRRLHIYRRYFVHSRSYLLYSVRETHFQLITTIEVV